MRAIRVHRDHETSEQLIERLAHTEDRAARKALKALLIGRAEAIAEGIREEELAAFRARALARPMLLGEERARLDRLAENPRSVA